MYYMSDGRAKNGGAREGAGRHVSEATIKAQLARKLIADRLEASLEPIVAKAITQALEGDFRAREWLSQNAWGKPAFNLGVGEGGESLAQVLVRFIDDKDDSNGDTD